MFSFRLGSIRVTVHPSHLLMGALFGYWALDSWNAGWPGSVLSDPAASNRLPTQVAVALIWTGIVFVSVLFHELGHAVSMRAYQYQPSIQLVMLGGFTSPNSPAPLPWRRDVVTTLAGPFFGAALALLCYGLLRLGPGDVLSYVFETAWRANLAWAIFNMVPVLPLDGGRVVLALLSRAFGRGGWRWRSGGSRSGFIVYQAVRGVAQLPAASPSSRSTTRV
jgi:Zn-dependent protease